GLNESVPATCFPTASALAASWNRDLVYQVGEALGEECQQEKVGVILGPGANIKRSPLCGRNFEYFSEDPYLSGEIAKSHINGVQSKGIGTSLKHYAANNQEYRRMTIDAVIDERALREIYLAGFEIAVREAQPWTVMCAYNKVNGTYASENPTLMTTILKDEWGHEGLVVTDWGAMNGRVDGLKAGVELEMPGSANGNDAKIVEAVKAGQLDESVLDKAVARILQLIFKVEETLSHDVVYDPAAHHALARQVAGEGAVLLKNEGSLLPLAKNKKIAIIGRFAKEPRYQGAGSSLMNPTQLDNFYDEMVKLVGEDNLSYAPGYDAKADAADAALIAEAKAIAQAADVVVICAGLTDMYEVEGLDREHMNLPPGHDALIAAIAEAHENVVVVLSNGSPVAMPWLDEVTVVLEGYLGGQAGAGALADILTGRVNPSGKLAETFPIKLEDNPSYHYFPGGPATVEYRESIFVGYRFYDAVRQAVLFPFGFGLSYTTFEYSDLQLSQDEISESDTLTVTFKVKNSGAIAGKEIVQVYVRDVETSVFRPEKELKGFEKVELEAGEETAVSIHLNRRAFAFYNTASSDWAVETGTFDILVGASSQDIRLQAQLSVKASQPVIAKTPEIYHNFPKGMPISQQDFAKLLGHPVPVNAGDTKGHFTINTPLEDLNGTFIGRQLNNMMQKQMAKMIVGQEETPTAALMEAMGRQSPLRTMLMMGDGSVTRDMLDALLVMLNGKSIKGAGALLKAMRNK
ncbi:MAG: glycoside hydrolase family 3 C-terminal domain-containing protein, partial [Anaerolineae bacterium]|nr:glycoside hydrolase family 3 C-terminal domain-containing protein [Anaerolineae bacterium]